jgi:hypothetical protein
MVTDLADSFWKSVRTGWQELQRRFVEKDSVCGDKAGSGKRRGREVARCEFLCIFGRRCE